MEYTVLFDQIIAFVPIFFYFFLLFKHNSNYKIQKVNIGISRIMVVVIGLLIGLTPFETGNDKYNYMLEYLGINSKRIDEFGWMIYCDISYIVFRSNFILFFLLTSFIYVCSYYVCGRHLFGRDKLGYFMIMSFGMLGFSGCGNNTIRNGLAIAVLIYSFFLPKQKWGKILLVFLSIMIHKSILIVVLSYAFAKMLNNRRYAELIWFSFLLLSLLDLNIDSLFQSYESADERFGKYVERKEELDSDSSFGHFRFDFLIYSVIPIIIANLWINRMKSKNVFYYRLYETYLLANSIWLLLIRLPQCNRIAYMSWFLIPLLTIYPLLTGLVRIKNAQSVLSLIIGMFLLVNFILVFKS